MLLVTTQPDSDYYIWQVQVQLNNFKKFGCEDKYVGIFGYNPKIGVNPKLLALDKKTRGKILYYPDMRDLSMRLYSPSIRPHLLKQLYQKNYEIIFNRNYLYLDSDIIFAEYPNFSELIDDKVIHVSDMASHVSFDSIKRKNNDLFELMCKSVGITSYIVNKNKKNGGGVVYLFKKNNYLDDKFWEKVEVDSNALYKYMLVAPQNFTKLEKITANKWALLWNIWLIGYDTKISDELSFTLPNTPINEWKKHNLYNNAGVKETEKSYLFYKNDFYNKSPLDADLSNVSDEYCSFNYVSEILDTAKNA